MTMIHTIPQITTALEEASALVAQVARDISRNDFFEGNDDNWSPGGYLQHLILSVKPYARGLQFPKEKLAERFGKSQGDSRNYDELVAVYIARLDAGVRAEDYPNAVPAEYRYPDNAGENKQAYLIETWRSANEQFIKALADWSEDDLDNYQMIHPAFGEITVREICFFTIHHNQLHSKDIAQNSSK